jgi:uncharacterized protein (DUF1330 family)
MSVLVVVQGTPHPERAETLQQYQSMALPLIQKYGGQAVARGKVVASLAGHHNWAVGSILRFPNLESVRAWHDDPEYQKIIPMRTKAYSDLEINVFQE